MPRVNSILSACTAVAILMLAMPAGADSLDISVNDDTARLTYQWQHPSRAVRVDGGWLHNQDRGEVIHLGVHVTGDASSGDAPLIGGDGGRVVQVRPHGGPQEAKQLGKGGFVRYTLPKYNRFNVYGHGYIAPDVLAFGDGAQYTEIEARFGYNVLRNADVFVGIRHIKTEFDPAGELTSDNGVHVGIQLRF